MACIDGILINEAKKEKDMDEMIDPIDSDMDMIDVLADIDDEDDEEVEDYLDSMIESQSIYADAPTM